jgi:predicted Rossmann fold nucleotide-binding protein DprA/Smf involved in DNA uptake
MSLAKWRLVEAGELDITTIALSNLAVPRHRWLEFRKLIGVNNVDELIDRILADRSLLDGIRKVIYTRYRGVLGEAAALAEELKREGVAFIPFYSPDYPEALRRYRLEAPVYRPLGLYVKPPVSLRNRFVGVVGTRDCSEWGRRVAWETGRLVVQAGFTLVTGLVECIDTSATLGALEAGGLAIGIRPWLKPLQLPGESRRLLEVYEDRIALASEHYIKPSVSPKTLYYMRNRIIAGMSDLVVVVEARPEGGSMHQITWSIRCGKRLAIYEHPDPKSEYYKAYQRYRSYSRTVTLKTTEDLGELLETLRALAKP